MSDNERLATMPGLHEPAPLFEADRTHGQKKLSDYRGRWLVLFLVVALQAENARSTATPENWHPSEKVITPSLKTMDATGWEAHAHNRQAQGRECIDWNFCNPPLENPAHSDPQGEAG